ncbi:MAG TPA: type I 3-dehydroquinate dehydratase, partial [Bryobacteraceae bacterium]|nr:type I 3-dehydroquinate dehydratase [Bryobacteraceae bacterium]
MAALPDSLPRICIALGCSTPEELSLAAHREYKDGGAFLEFRLDYLPDPAMGVALVRDLRETYPDLRILATCRHQRYHGRFAGPPERQIEILSDAGRAGASALDLEVEAAEPSKGAAVALRSLAPLIVSYHDFEKTPPLQPVLNRLLRIPADAFKIAVTARKPSDNLRVLDFLRQPREAPLIAMAMSEIGAASRILSPAMGSLFTYAAPLDAHGTAPGQVPAPLLRTLYRADRLGPHTRIFGVIADPVAHSKSPSIHNRALHARRIDAVYLPFRVAPAQLRDWMVLAAGLPVSGFSVTIPHKQRIVRYLDVVEPLAKRIGAVNTVWRKAGKWRGTNTDVAGVLEPLRRRFRVPHRSILIAGYGGAARAAAFALADAGAKVTITGRNLKSAQLLAAAVKAEALPLAAASAAD